MKAAIFSKVGSPLTVETVPDPVPGPDEIILKVARCGVCGSDLHATEDGLMTLPAGSVMGHEFAGEVAATGPGVTGWKEGQLVTALPFISCGHCAPCHRGDSLHCTKIISTGLGQNPGAYAEFVRVGTNDTIALPASVGVTEGALIEPLAVGFHAVEMARLSAGANILVLGAGPVGLSVALFARFFGARNIIVSEPAPARAALAAKMGATDAITERNDIGGQFRKLANGMPPDVIFECVGVPGMIGEAINLAPRAGRIVIVGVCSKPDQFLPLPAIMKELQLQFVLAYRKRDFELIAHLLASDRIDPAPMLTETVGFDAFPAAFEGLRQPQGQCKIMLDPWH